MEIGASKNLISTLRFVDHFDTLRPSFAMVPHLFRFKTATAEMLLKQAIVLALGIIPDCNKRLHIIVTC